MPITDDDLIEKAKVAYYRRSRRDAARGIHWPQVSTHSWFCEPRGNGEDLIEGYASFGNIDWEKPIVRYRWTGLRLVNLKI